MLKWGMLKKFLNFITQLFKRTPEKEPVSKGEKHIADPYRALAAAVILNAIKEWRTPNIKECPNSREISRAFFMGEFFETCCWLNELDPGIVREQLRKRYGFQYSETAF